MKNFYKKFGVGLMMFMFIIGATFHAVPVHATSDIKAIVDTTIFSGNFVVGGVHYYDPNNNSELDFQYFQVYLGNSGGLYTDDPTFTPEGIQAGLQSQILSYASGHSYTMNSTDIIWEVTSTLSSGELLGVKTATQAKSFNNTASHSIVTTAAAANGWQISSTRDASVFYSVNVNTTASIGGAADGYVVLEISATNSTTASDWKEVSRTRNGQTITLALALNSVQNIGGELMNIVPAGYYVRLRSVNVSGTPTYSYVSGQEVQL